MVNNFVKGIADFVAMLETRANGPAKVRNTTNVNKKRAATNHK